ncbi:serine hydrolase [Shewanella cyperi]|uniref:serine hydrolase n=1 Tax=Shewanella cyperi TaxID=2814292 RepID=UPI001A94310B|nr:serine hydrolase [Shewanella cyperi]QSX39286.1 serine hydrolase [Shewanella cyperi]
MHKFAKWTLALLLLPAAAMAKDIPPTTASAVDSIVSRYAELDMFSGTVVLAKQGEVVFSAAYGEANRDYHIPNGMNTRFNIGSIGKTLTSVAIMQLVESGKLGLDDKLAKYLPDFPFPEKDTISIQQLLNHSSGLGDYMELDAYKQQMADLHTIGDILPLIYQQPPLSPPGADFNYSNSGMVLLGAIIEKVSGLSYPDYLRRYVFEPADMHASELAQEDQILAERAIGYIASPKGGYSSNVRSIMPASADGGLRTTALDLLKFDQALTHNKLLRQDSIDKMLTPVGPVPFYASGWFVKMVGDKKVVGHSGGAPGVSSEYRRYADDGYTLVILSNYDNVASPLAEDLEKALFNIPFQLPTKVDAEVNRAANFEQNGEIDAALTILDRLGSDASPHVDSLYRAARLRIVEKRDVEKALPALNSYIALAGADARPSIAAAWWRKGNAYEQLGDKNQARSCYQQSLSLEPENTDAREALTRMGN